VKEEKTTKIRILFLYRHHKHIALDNTPRIRRHAAGPPSSVHASPPTHVMTEKSAVSETLDSFRNTRR
jgi:hypothetical protein